VSSRDELVLVIGGSSGTGRAAAQRLHGRGVPTRVVSRDPVRAALQLPQGLNICAADITKPDTLPAALKGAGHIILTAGLYSGHPASNSRARATEYAGVLNTLAAARAARFTGRFLYMTASGVRSRAISAVALNAWKGNTLGFRSPRRSGRSPSRRVWRVRTSRQRSLLHSITHRHHARRSKWLAYRDHTIRIGRPCSLVCAAMIRIPRPDTPFPRFRRESRLTPQPTERRKPILRRTASSGDLGEPEFSGQRRPPGAALWIGKASWVVDLGGSESALRPLEQWSHLQGARSAVSHHCDVYCSPGRGLSD